MSATGLRTAPRLTHEIADLCEMHDPQPRNDHRRRWWDRETTVTVAAAQLFQDRGGGAVTFVELARVASEEFVPVSTLP